ncbi:MAG: hypothetical protein LBQ77_06515 [Treponema sp.]|jgi:hypothetical protein|nr:hypothetical protein [Treponema sp.]
MSATEVRAKIMNEVQIKFLGDKIKYVEAFFDGEYDDSSMHLEQNDWSIIKAILNDFMSSMDKDTFNALNGELVSRGIN